MLILMKRRNQLKADERSRCRGFRRLNLKKKEEEKAKETDEADSDRKGGRACCEA